MFHIEAGHGCARAVHAAIEGDAESNSFIDIGKHGKNNIECFELP